MSFPSASPWAASRSISPFDTDSAMPAPSAGGTLQQTLPAPPPSVKKKATIWDNDHISETLLGIGQAFLSNQNFGEGLGAAAGVMADRNAGLRREAQKSVTYGGPNNRFEIMTDAQGNRTVREVPEFAKAAQDERDAKARAEREAKAAPSWKEAQDLKARLVYQIGKLPADQRAAAYADLIANPQRYGISPEGMPSAWSDTYGTVAGNSGMTVAQASSNERGDRIADNRIATNDARTAQGAARVDLARAADARAERRSTLRKVPAAVTRKATIKTPTGFILD